MTEELQRSYDPDELMDQAESLREVMKRLLKAMKNCWKFSKGFHQ